MLSWDMHKTGRSIARLVFIWLVVVAALLTMAPAFAADAPASVGQPLNQESDQENQSPSAQAPASRNDKGWLDGLKDSFTDIYNFFTDFTPGSWMYEHTNWVEPDQWSYWTTTVPILEILKSAPDWKIVRVTSPTGKVFFRRAPGATKLSGAITGIGSLVDLGFQIREDEGREDLRSSQKIGRASLSIIPFFNLFRDAGDFAISEMNESRFMGELGLGWDYWLRNSWLKDAWIDWCNNPSWVDSDKPLNAGTAAFFSEKNPLVAGGGIFINWLGTAVGGQSWSEWCNQPSWLDYI